LLRPDETRRRHETKGGPEPIWGEKGTSINVISHVHSRRKGKPSHAGAGAICGTVPPSAAKINREGEDYGASASESRRPLGISSPTDGESLRESMAISRGEKSGKEDNELRKVTRGVKPCMDPMCNATRRRLRGKRQWRRGKTPGQGENTVKGAKASPPSRKGGVRGAWGA